MTDKEVGELWRECHLYEEEFEVRQLIRKLVEERRLHYNIGLDDPPNQAGLQQALRDFGIKEEEWL